MGIEAGEGGSNITCDFDYLNITITSTGSTIFCGLVNINFNNNHKMLPAE